MATICKRGKIWYVIYNLDGKQHWKAIGRSKEIADLALKRDYVTHNPVN